MLEPFKSENGQPIGKGLIAFDLPTKNGTTMSLFDSDAEKEYLTLIIKSAVSDGVGMAMDRHVEEKHKPQDKINEEVRHDLNTLFKFRTQTVTVGSTVLALASVAWGDLKGFFR